jgi:hypothetical protein
VHLHVHPPQLRHRDGLDAAQIADAGGDSVQRSAADLESRLCHAKVVVEQYRDANPVSKVWLGMGKAFDAIMAMLSRPLCQGPPAGWLTKFTDPADVHILARPRTTVQVRAAVAMTWGS